MQADHDNCESEDESAPLPHSEPMPYATYLLRFSLAWIPIAYAFTSGKTPVAIFLAIFYVVAVVGIAIHWFMWRSGRLE